MIVLAFDEDADAGRRAGFGVDHPDLVIEQVHLPQAGEAAVERLAKRGVQGVHRAVALGHFVPQFAMHAEFHGRFGDHIHPVVSQPRQRGT